jgi:hypothetical protein
MLNVKYVKKRTQFNSNANKEIIIIIISRFNLTI